MHLVHIRLIRYPLSGTTFGFFKMLPSKVLFFKPLPNDIDEVKQHYIKPLSMTWFFMI